MHTGMRPAIQHLENESANLKLSNAQPIRAAELRFSKLVSVLEGIASCGRLTKRKVARIRRFFLVEVPRTDGDDLLQLFRLLLPKLDFKRGYFGIKEKRFAGLLAAALGACQQRAEAAKDWMRLAHQTQSKFPTVMQKVLLDHYCPAAFPPESDTLTVDMVNAALDQLAAIASGAVGATANPGDDERSRAAALRGRQPTAQQAAVLRDLMRRCTPRAAWWLIHIVLRADLPIGMGEKALLNAFHPDAHDAFKSCSDLRLVLDGLCRPRSAWRRREVEPGLNAAPQLASRVDGGPEAAAKCMKGRPFLVETKFDGWRIQLHVTGDVTGGGGTIHYFSRNVKDHGKRSSFCVLDGAVAQLLRPEAEPAAAPGGAGAGARPAVPAPEAEPQPRGALPRVVLDGEMLVWNKTRRCFEPFGMLEAAIKAAAEGMEPEAPVYGRDALPMADAEDGVPLCPTAGELEVVYVAFDILYLRDTSVVHLPLQERKRLLGSVFRPLVAEEGGPPGGVPLGHRGAVTFRAEALLPERPMFDGKVHCWTCSTPQQAQEVYDLNAAAFEEGIVVKALEEPYHISGRTKTWIKIKPDYLSQGEFDAVILGQMYDHCSNRVSGGGVYLLGLPEEPPQPGKPTTYVTFATVGSGVTREQRRSLLEPRLAGNMVASPRGAEGGGRAARLRAVPHWCRATGSRDEWPDWWVVDPEKSVVVQVNADVRLTRTANFAAGYTTRFPRITRIRDDKGPRDATTLQELRALVRQAGADAAAAGGGAGGAARVGPGTGAVGGRGGSRRSALRQPRQPARPAVAPVPLNLLTSDTSELPVHFDLLGGAYVVLEGLYGAAAARRRSELSRLVRLMGGRCSANYVPSGECRTSYVIVDEWVDSCHGRQTRRDLLRPDWLEDCYLQRRLIWPPKPAHAWRLSAATLAAHADQVDAYGDPYYELLDEQDLAAVLDWHVNPADVKQARQALAEAEAAALGPGEARHRRRRRGVGERVAAAASSCCNGAACLPADTADGLLHWLEAEMRAVGEEPLAAVHRLFAEATVLLLDVSPSAAAAAAAAGGGLSASLPTAAAPSAARVQPGASCLDESANAAALDAARWTGGIAAGAADADAGRGVGAVLLQGVAEAGALAARWAAEEARQQLAELRLAVLHGGGQLTDCWSPTVTHVVLFRGFTGFEEAGERLAGAPDGWAGCNGDGGHGGGGDAAAAAAAIGSAAPLIGADAVLAVLQSKCARRHWDEARAELTAHAAYITAAAANTTGAVEARPDSRSSGSSGSSSSCCCCCCCCHSFLPDDNGPSDSDGETEDDAGEGLESGLLPQPQQLLLTGAAFAAPRAEQASRPACGPHAHPQHVAARAQRGHWRWASGLARLLHWLGADCGGAHRIRGAGPAGGVHVTDWRWIPDCLREAERATAAGGRGWEEGAPTQASSAGGRAGNQRATEAAGGPLAAPGADAAVGEGGAQDSEDDDGECGSEDDSPTDNGVAASCFVRLPEALYPPRLAPTRRAPRCRPHADPAPSHADTVGGAVAQQTDLLAAVAAADLPAGVPPAVRQHVTEQEVESQRGALRGPRDAAAGLSAGSTRHAARGSLGAAGTEAERPVGATDDAAGKRKAGATTAITTGPARSSQPAEEPAEEPPGLQMASCSAGLQAASCNLPPASSCRGVDTGPAACAAPALPLPSPHGGGGAGGAQTACCHISGAWSGSMLPLPPAKPGPRLGSHASLLRRILESSSDDDDDDNVGSDDAVGPDGVAGGTAVGLQRAHPPAAPIHGPGPATIELRASPAAPSPAARSPGTSHLRGRAVEEAAFPTTRTDVAPLPPLVEAAAAAASSVSSPVATRAAPFRCQLVSGPAVHDGRPVHTTALDTRLPSGPASGAAQVSLAGAGTFPSMLLRDSFAVRTGCDSRFDIDSHPRGVGQSTADPPLPDLGRGEQAACGGPEQQQQQQEQPACRNRTASGRLATAGGTGARCAAPDDPRYPPSAGMSAASPSVAVQEVQQRQQRQREKPVVPAAEEEERLLGRTMPDSRKRIRGLGGDAGGGAGDVGPPGQKASSLGGSGLGGSGSGGSGSGGSGSGGSGSGGSGSGGSGSGGSGLGGSGSGGSGSGGSGLAGSGSSRNTERQRSKRRRRSWLVVFETLAAGDDTEDDADVKL